MSLYYYEPFFSLDDFQRLFDDFFDRSERSTDRPVGERQVSRREEGGQRSLARGFQPRMDIHEASDQNVVTATFELPGLTKENVQIDVQPGRLTVSGEQTVSNDVDEKGFVHRERRYGRFERSLPLPSGAKPTDIKASMENGVLSVTFPKTSPEQVPQRITIA
ncbi:hypothetical protein ACEPAH_9025 [Sanghuangporus vaninii]